jgi:catechol 2,3-dioxygenase-like lactoylglutathione lyase family enzyme
MSNLKLKKIDCILFCVADLLKAAEFYEEVLGLKKG